MSNRKSTMTAVPWSSKVSKRWKIMSLLGILIGQKSFWLTLPTFLQKYCPSYYPDIIRIFKVTMDAKDLVIIPRSLSDEIKLYLFIVILFFLVQNLIYKFYNFQNWKILCFNKIDNNKGKQFNSIKRN